MSGPLALILLSLGGVLAGVVNTLAGGGSLITVPLLIASGLSPNVANGTNRIAVLVQSVVSTWTLHKRGVSGIKPGLWLIPPGVIGAAIGAYAATVISDAAFKTVFAVIMIPIALLIYLQPKRFFEERERSQSRRGGVVLMLAVFAAGIYAGFVQAGFGLLALAVLVLLGGFDLKLGNAVKVFLNAVLTVVSLAVFAVRIDIDVSMGLTLAVSMGLGGYLGSLAVLNRGERWIRPAVLISCVALSIHLLL